MRALVNGRAGYIGSQACVALLEAGNDITVFDNLCNSSKIALGGVHEITGKSLTCTRGGFRNPKGCNPPQGGADASRLNLAGICADAGLWQCVKPSGCVQRASSAEVSATP